MFEEGPYLRTACFCESVIEGKDGVLSLIRLIDLLTITVSGPEAPDDMPPVDASYKLVVASVPGAAKGRHEVKIVPELPSGIRENDRALVVSVHFESEGKVTPILIDYRYRFEQEGLYWFHLLLDDQLWSKIPFQVRYNRLTAGSYS